MTMEVVFIQYSYFNIVITEHFGRQQQLLDHWIMENEKNV